MQLQPGAVAPLFAVDDVKGGPVRLADYGGRHLLLSFFRNGGCAMCNLRVQQMIQRYADFQRMGLDVVAVFESPASSIHEHVGKQDPPFPIIADPDAVLYDLYGVEESAEKVQRTIARPETAGFIRLAAKAGFRLAHEEGSNMNRIPADFLIGPDGVVRLAHYAEFVTDHLPFAEIEACLDADVLTAATGSR